MSSNVDRKFLRAIHTARLASLFGLAASLSACNTAPSTSSPAQLAGGSGAIGAANTAGAHATAGTTAPVTTAGTGVTGVGTAGVTGLGTAGVGVAGSAGGGGAIDDSDAGVNTGAAGTLAAEGGTGGASGATGDGGAAGAAGATEPTHPDLGMGNGSDVVLIGDSWMSNTLQIEGTGGGLAPSLIAEAKEPYRNYAVQGVMLLQADTFGPAIPSQWDQAKAVNPAIKTVVMTGGGNDIIQNATIQASCTMGTDPCKQLLMQVSDELNKLWTQMATDGVQDIVYVQYATDVGTTDPSVRASQKTPEICTSGKVRCHAVDSTAAVMHQIAADNIHPLQAANQRLAKVVYDLMVSEGIRR